VGFGNYAKTSKREDQETKRAGTVRSGLKTEKPPPTLHLPIGGGSRTDELLVPHHGSKTSSSAEFLDVVQPRYAMAQAGYRNRFGHPAPPVLERYRERGIRIVDSPHCGAMARKS
jgi:competence protein ComEC